MKVKLITILSFFFLMATCKNKNAVGIDHLLLIKDPTAYGIADSLKYLIPILDSVFYNDQKFRYDAHLSTESEKKAHVKAFLANRNEIEKIDQRNLQIVKGIIEKHGWLGTKDVGFKASQTLFSVIQHADIQTQEAYLPLLKKAFNEGRIAPANYAMYLDRISMGKRIPQVYGTQLTMENNVPELYPLMNVDSVDAWRKSVGWDSIKFYLRIWNIEWDAEVYKRKLPSLREKYKVRDSL